MTTQQIVERGIELTREHHKTDAELRSLNNMLEHRFPGKLTHETIDTKYGRAVRTVCREWWIMPGHLDRVRAILGDARAHLIDPEQPQAITPGLRALLKNDDSQDGIQIRPHAVVNCTVRITFAEPNSETVVGDGQESEVIQSQQILGENNAN